MPGRLASFVHVRDGDDVTHVFGPDDEIPDWAAAKITNPKAWAQAPDVVIGVDASQDGNPASDGDGAAPTPGDGRPPKTGQGSSREVWAAYAAVRGLDVPAEATKAEIIAAVEAAEQQ